MRFKFALLTADVSDITGWKKSLSKVSNVSYDVVDLSKHDWLENCLSCKYDCYLLRAPGSTNSLKQLFDERVSILNNDLGLRIYPSWQEIKIYENKKLLSYWLKAKEIASPHTAVFYERGDAGSFIRNCKLPLVAKINIGSSGKGVRILRTSQEVREYVEKAFKLGVKPYVGPNFKTASVYKKVIRAFKTKGLLHKRIKTYRNIISEPQRFVILQEFIPHDFEWRVVVIGSSFFAHKKMVLNEKASGSLIKLYDNPPTSLLDFARELCQETKLSSVSLDIFETSGGFLVNEIQTFFGQSDLFQMKVDGIIGRYRFVNDEWVFEPGDWAANECYDLRLNHVLEILKGEE